MDVAKETASKISSKEKELERKLVVLWDELPSWQQDNHYILSGYRPQTNSYTGSAKSLGYIHNETVNIYSHLIGAIAALVGGLTSFYLLQPRYQTATKEDVLVFGCYFGGAVACLGMSATYHTIQNHSPEVSSFGNKLDYLGIVFLIWGSFIPVLYYGFQAEPQLIRTYWTMVRKLYTCSIR
jgi:adiponectin receptor